MKKASDAYQRIILANTQTHQTLSVNPQQKKTRRSVDWKPNAMHDLLKGMGRWK